MAVSIHNVLNGQLPRRMYVMLVDHRAFNGSATHDPFKFQHCNINEIVAYIDGAPFPDTPYKPNFATKMVGREYRALFESLQQNNFQPVLQMKKDEFITDNTIFCI